MDVFNILNPFYWYKKLIAKKKVVDRSILEIVVDDDGAPRFDVECPSERLPPTTKGRFRLYQHDKKLKINHQNPNETHPHPDEYQRPMIWNAQLGLWIDQDSSWKYDGILGMMNGLPQQVLQANLLNDVNSRYSTVNEITQQTFTPAHGVPEPRYDPNLTNDLKIEGCGPNQQPNVNCLPPAQHHDLQQPNNFQPQPNYSEQFYEELHLYGNLPAQMNAPPQGLIQPMTQPNAQPVEYGSLLNSTHYDPTPPMIPAEVATAHQEYSEPMIAYDSYNYDDSGSYSYDMSAVM